MTDDHADTPAADAEDHADADDGDGDGDADEDRPSSDTMSTPGGGPRRVVSNKGVDDILESLNSGPAGGAGAREGAGEKPETETEADTENASENVETADEERPSPANGPADTDAPETTAGPDSDTRNERASTSSASEALSAIRDGHAGDANDWKTGAERGSDDTASEPSTTELSFEESDVDGLEGASGDTPEDDSRLDPEDLADRIDSGTVTGADVRAAEAGEGREKTPEVDEIELSMDDLEQTQASTGGSSSSSTGGTGDGPLAGTIDPNGAGAATDSSDGGTDDGPGVDADSDSDADSNGSGLLGRVRSLFSR